MRVIVSKTPRKPQLTLEKLCAGETFRFDDEETNNRISVRTNEGIATLDTGTHWRLAGDHCWLKRSVIRVQGAFVEGYEG